MFLVDLLSSLLWSFLCILCFNFAALMFKHSVMLFCGLTCDSLVENSHRQITYDVCRMKRYSKYSIGKKRANNAAE